MILFTLIRCCVEEVEKLGTGQNTKPHLSSKYGKRRGGGAPRTSISPSVTKYGDFPIPFSVRRGLLANDVSVILWYQITSVPMLSMYIRKFVEFHCCDSCTTMEYFAHSHQTIDNRNSFRMTQITVIHAYADCLFDRYRNTILPWIARC